MAPPRSSTRRAQHLQENIVPSAGQDTNTDDVEDDLFIDPMLGTPLALYIEKDVQDKETLVQLITKHGGSISPGYSGVPYILVDPNKSSGQNLYRQYAGKKGKIVLDARWVHECVKAGELQTFHTNYAGCKVTGTEMAIPQAGDVQAGSSTPMAVDSQPQTRGRTRQSRVQQTQTQPPPPPPPPQPMQVDQLPRQVQQPAQILQQAIQPPAIPVVDPMGHAQNPFAYAVYPHMQVPPRAIHSAAGPPQTWQNGIAPQQTHLNPQPLMLPRVPFRDDSWDGYAQTGDPLVGPPPTGYDYRYREDQAAWAGTPGYYDGGYVHAYEQPAPYMEEPNATSNIAGPSTLPPETPEKPRGRKRTRPQATPAAPASALVINRNPPARSPTPPTRVIKSTYGGNLFTAEDVLYLKKYIDYCQEQGLVLSLREICERIAVKAPHHTFYSWRRYCNKHQIRLGGYMMNPDRDESPMQDGDQDMEAEETATAATTMLHRSAGPGTIAAAHQPVQTDMTGVGRTRSPTPPRALYRSTTGKGVAFTDADITFLVRFMEHRKAQGRLDMVSFWKDVAAKAPHHSRASWMKFWRRHKHELNRAETDDPLPQPPDKKMRYSREDDILLAKHFANKPEGTSDKIFQAFGRLHPHHPWKGWQEHHRIHKAKIDHFIEQLQSGESIDDEPEAEAE